MTDKYLELIVENIDLYDPATEQIISEHLSDLVWGSVDGQVTVATLGDFDDFVCAASLIARRITTRLPGAKVTRWYEDFVTTSQIAQRAGVTREAVRLWAQAQRGPKTFPSPHHHAGSANQRSAEWVWARVSEWLDANGLEGDGYVFPSDLEIAEINADLARANIPLAPIAFVTPELAYKAVPVLNRPSYLLGVWGHLGAELESRTLTIRGWSGVDKIAVAR